MSLLKYSIKHPKLGVQIIQSAYQAWDDSKENIIKYEMMPLNINQIIKNLFPNTEVSTIELKQKLVPLENQIKTFIEKLENVQYPSQKKPYPINYSMDNQSGLLLYTLCKIIKPNKVVETGIAYGLSSAYVLQALHENKKGKLYSIDFTFRPWESKEMIGSFIPDDLRDRWELIFGPSSDKLQNLLESLGSIDIFIHDSLHTFKNMIYEFNTAWPFIEKNGFLLSDDILSNNAFHFFCSSVNLKPLILLQESQSKSFGILQKT